MKNIKEKSSHFKLRDFDKAVRISRNAKAAFFSPRDEKNIDANPENYAYEKISSGTQKTFNTAIERGRRFARKSREAFRTIRNSSHTIKASNQSVKAASRSAKTTVKAAKVTVEASRKAAVTASRTVKAASRAAVHGIRLAVKAAIAAVKGIAAAIKGLSAAIAAGGWVVLVVVFVVAAVAALLCSPSGIFYSNDTTENHTPAAVMAELRQELLDKIESIKQARPEASEVTVTYTGSDDTAARNGVDILAVFAVRVAMDPDDPTEVVTLDDAKEAILRQTYWDMTHLSYTVEPIDVGETLAPVSSPSDTSAPSPVMVEIKVEFRPYNEMVDVYGFCSEQIEALEELMQPEYRQLFMALLE